MLQPSDADESVRVPRPFDAQSREPSWLNGLASVPFVGGLHHPFGGRRVTAAQTHARRSAGSPVSLCFFLSWS